MQSGFSPVLDSSHDPVWVFPPFLFLAQIQSGLCPFQIPSLIQFGFCPFQILVVTPSGFFPHSRSQILIQSKISLILNPGPEQTWVFPHSSSQPRPGFWTKYLKGKEGLCLKTGAKPLLCFPLETFGWCFPGGSSFCSSVSAVQVKELHILQLITWRCASSWSRSGKC